MFDGCGFAQGEFSSPFLVYHEMVKTTKVFVRDCSMVNPYALLLFGGEINVMHAEGMLIVDQWMRFRAPVRTAVLVRDLRVEIDNLLQQKVADPSSRIEERCGCATD